MKLQTQIGRIFAWTESLPDGEKASVVFLIDSAALRERLVFGNCFKVCGESLNTNWGYDFWVGNDNDIETAAEMLNTSVQVLRDLGITPETDFRRSTVTKSINYVARATTQESNDDALQVQRILDEAKAGHVELHEWVAKTIKESLKALNDSAIAANACKELVNETARHLPILIDAE